MTIRLRGPERPPAAGGPARSLCVLLHGFGADGSDLIGLAEHWARVLPHCRFMAPDAPERCDMAPTGRQWFSLRGRAEQTARAGVERAAAAIDAFLDGALAAHKLRDENLALAGFSQGTMIALHVALRRRRAPACVLGYSGRLLDSGAAAREARAKPPVLLIHGDADDMVPVQALEDARIALGAAGAPTQWHVRRGLGHAIDPEGLAVGGRFLRDCLARRARPVR